MTTIAACTMRFFKSAPLLTVSVLCWFMVACPAANILRPNPSGASTRSDHQSSGRSSISNAYEPLFRTSSSQFGSLDKRDDSHGLSLFSFEPGELFMPIQTAVEVLEAFYTGIAMNAHGEWRRKTPRIWIRITLGAIGLVMTATEGTTVPWEFVTWFALEMLKLTERGYTGMYTASFVHPTMGNTIWVSLYHCVIGPLTVPAAVGAPTTVGPCLNPNAQAWFPARGTPTR